MNRIFNFGKNKKDSEKEVSLVPFKKFDIDNLFEGFFDEPFFGGFGFLREFKAPAIDVYEEGDKVIVKADLPGIDKKDIKLNLDRDILTISGESKKEKEEKKKGYYYSERSYGSVQRSIRVPENTKLEEIKASYKDGVLTVEVPRSEEAREKGRDIEIE